MSKHAQLQGVVDVATLFVTVDGLFSGCPLLQRVVAPPALFWCVDLFIFALFVHVCMVCHLTLVFSAFLPKNIWLDIQP